MIDYFSGFSNISNFESADFSEVAALASAGREENGSIQNEQNRVGIILAGQYFQHLCARHFAVDIAVVNLFSFHVNLRAISKNCKISSTFYIKLLPNRIGFMSHKNLWITKY